MSQARDDVIYDEEGIPRDKQGVNIPRQYVLSNHAEFLRLIRECRGYLATCRREHHGTDAEGRQYAILALDEITKARGRLVTPSER